MKLWGGRFSKETDREANDFQSSISFDARLYREDIEGSVVHARMLARRGIITAEDAEAIERGLLEILADIEAGRAELSPDNEDIHMNIEALLTERIGDAGKKLHTARSRNDQVAVDLRLYLSRETDAVQKAIAAVTTALLNQAASHTRTVMPGYTHLQRAQPITFAHHLLAYCEMFRRDIGRLTDCAARMSSSPLGCCALAGTTHPIDRAVTARELGFHEICRNSLDGVSDRDYVIELASALSIIMMHVSRLAEEIIIWSSREFSFIELDEAYSTGSSIMPQKKNPDMAELARGKTGRVYGSLIALLTMMKGLPLAYNKDMQEDKEQIFDAVDTVKSVLGVIAGMIETMRPRPEAMRAAASSGFINATDAADYLAKRGVPFRDAYTIVGGIVRECEKRGIGLDELPLDDLKGFSPVFDADFYDEVSLDRCVEARKSAGGPSLLDTERVIAETRAFLAAMR